MHNRSDNRSINGSSYCARLPKPRRDRAFDQFPAPIELNPRMLSVVSCQLSVVSCQLRPYPIAERRPAPGRGGQGLALHTTDHGPRTTDYYGVVDWLLIFL